MAPRSDNAVATVDDQAKAEVATITDKRILEKFGEMAIAIPSEVGGGTERILEQILSATTWDELDQPWETTPIDDILGKRLRIIEVTRRPSTFGGGLGIFLVVKLRDWATKKEYVKTTGSVSVVGQIAAAYFKGWMPIEVEWCRADRPTEQGYYPQHLKVTNSFAPDPPARGTAS